jgi:hypothetical protein
MAIAGVLVVAGGGWATGRYAFTAPAPPRLVQLVVIRTALPAGIRLSGADLRVVTVHPGDGVPAGAVGPAAAVRLLGLVIRNAVPDGTFLTSSLVAPGGALPDPAQALVGLALKAGQLPAGGLAVGQQVLVVLLPTNSQGQVLNPVPLVTTTVWYLRGADSSGTTLATIIVPARLATRLASFAAQGQVALVATARPGGPAVPSTRASSKPQSPSTRASSKPPGPGTGTGRSKSRPQH